MKYSAPNPVKCKLYPNFPSRCDAGHELVETEESDRIILICTVAVNVVPFLPSASFIGRFMRVCLVAISSSRWRWLYAYKSEREPRGMAWHGVPHAALQPSAASLSILVDVQMPLKSEGGRRMGNWMKGGERKGEAEGSSVGGRTANNKSLRASEREACSAHKG